MLFSFFFLQKLMLEKLNAEFDRLECRVALVTDVYEWRIQIWQRERGWVMPSFMRRWKKNIKQSGENWKIIASYWICHFQAAIKKLFGPYKKLGKRLNKKIVKVETSTPDGVWKSELQKLREVTENRSSASQPLEGQNVREPEGSLMSSKGKRTRSPGSTSGEKERKRYEIVSPKGIK